MEKNGKLKNRIVWSVISAYGRAYRKRCIAICRDAGRSEAKLLRSVLARNASTEFGRKYGFKSIHSVEEYQDRVPFTTYPDYKDYIERTSMHGEQKLITRDRISFLANTSGTTGVTKHIPVVTRSYAPYLGCIAMFFSFMKKELDARGVRGGKVMNTIETESTVTPGGIRQGFISSFVVGSSGMMVESMTCLPMEVLKYGDTVDMKYIKARCVLGERGLVGMVGAFMSTMVDLMGYIEQNREMLVRDIRLGTIDPSISIPQELRNVLLKRYPPDPERADSIEKAFEGGEEGLIVRLWSNMVMIVAIGTGEFAPFAQRLRRYCGDGVKFCYSMYCASESLFASAIGVEDENYLMLPNAGFFEFIPADDESLDEKTMRPLLMHQLEKGRHYEVVVTSLAGLYRYRIRDVITVEGYCGTAPLIRFSYRKDQLINITGVKLTAEHITNAISGFEKRIGVKVLDYSVYPDTSRTPWRIQAFLELDGQIPESLGSEAARIFDEELAKVNAEHGRMLKIGESSPSVVCTVKRGSYARYREESAKAKHSGNQVKSVRYIDTPDKLEYYNSCVEHVYEQPEAKRGGQD